MLHVPIQWDNMWWSVYLSSHGYHSDHHVLHMIYYVTCRCDKYMNEDVRFGRQVWCCVAVAVLLYLMRTFLGPFTIFYAFQTGPSGLWKAQWQAGLHLPHLGRPNDRAGLCTFRISQRPSDRLVLYLPKFWSYSEKLGASKGPENTQLQIELDFPAETHQLVHKVRE
jgi:hypothetical protein